MKVIHIHSVEKDFSTAVLCPLFLDSLSQNPKLTDWLDWLPASPYDLPVSTHQSNASVTGTYVVPGFYLSDGHPNSGSHACTANP